MGLFSRKKKNESSFSTLSEAEIQQRLYGEFKRGEEDLESREPARPARESFKSSLPSQTRLETTPDLFHSPSSVAPIKSHESFIVNPPEEKKAELPKYVSPSDFPKKEIHAYGASPASYERPKYLRQDEKKTGESLGQVFRGFLFGIGKIFATDNVLARRSFYWIGSIGMILLLFWGVNALNMKRETALRSKYPVARETSRTEPATSEEQNAVTRTADSEKISAVIPAVASTATRPMASDSIRTTPKQTGLPATTGRGPSGGSYVIQVATYALLEDANKVAENLKREKFNVLVKENQQTRTGRPFYVVFLGGYRTEAEAKEQLVRFRSKEISRPFQDAFVKNLG